MSKGKIIVVGAGVFGITAALELQTRGYKVAVVAPGPLPHPHAASTDISKIVRMDYGDDEFYVALMEKAFPLWYSWNQKWPKPLYHETGILFMTQKQMTKNTFEYDGFHLLKKRNHAVERIDAEILQQRYPIWNCQKYIDGYFNPKGGWADSEKVVAELIKEAREKGIEICETKVKRLWQKESQVLGVETIDNNKLAADITIIAAGAWTPKLVPHLQNVLQSTAQVIMHFLPSAPENFQKNQFPVWTADIANTGWYGFPTQESGILKIANHGVGWQISPDIRDVPEDPEKRTREFLAKTFAVLKDAPLKTSKLCFYCDSWDGDFWIDHDPQHKGLFIAAGGSGHGFKFAPVLGEIIADIVEHKPNPYAHRFAWRKKVSAKKEGARFTGEE